MNWKRKWGYEVKPTPAIGVLETPDGYLVHGKVSRHGKKRRVMRLVRVRSLRDAQRARLDLLEEKKGSAGTRPLFSGYAASLLERKIAQRDLKSAKTRERWGTTLTNHLVPHFGSWPVDAIGRVDVEQWKTRVANRIRRGKLSPRTANGWLSILRIILRTAVLDYDLDRDPTLQVKDFPTVENPTYTDEEPNALTPSQCPEFLQAMLRLYPQHYPMVLLGMVTGLRPSTLRPIRRKGPKADVLWDDGAILVRRSNSLGSEVMNTTKTALSYRLTLPPELMEVLRAHAAGLWGPRGRSSLLFPSKTGGFLSRSALDKPFARVSKAVGLTFTFTPRGMRRTYQDLGRAQKIEKKVRKAICGHKTDAMSDLYETVEAEEMRAAVVSIMAKATGKVAA